MRQRGFSLLAVVVAETLTRRRRTVLSDGTAERNRVQKVLEDANVKIGNVLSDGVSGQAMLEALLENKRSATEIAELPNRYFPSLLPCIRFPPAMPAIVPTLSHSCRIAEALVDIVAIELTRLTFLSRANSLKSIPVTEIP